MRFGIVFLACPLKLSEDQRRALMLTAIRAHQAEVHQAPVEIEGVRGQLKALDAVTLGGMSGRLFEAQVATPEGDEGLLRFLVADRELQLYQGGPVAEA